MKAILSPLLEQHDALRIRQVELRRDDDGVQLREKLARVVLDEMYQFVALLDRHGTLLEVNRAALEGAGIRLDDILGKPFWEARWWRVSKETMERQRQACATAAAGEFVRFDVEIYGDAAGEETIIIDYSLIPVADRTGRVVFLLAEGRNITEKKRAEAEIARKNQELELLLARVREMDELKSQFFANVSHELRTPLALMLGPTERMLATSALSAADRRDIEVIRKNAFMLLKHVNDLLDAAKIDAGQMTLTYRAADIAELTRAIAGHFEALAAERDIRFVVHAPDRLAAEFDVEKIERVLLNLLSNAFKFTPAGGRITCALAPDEGGRVVASVQDTGPGVPPDLRTAIFERFRQGEGGAARKSGGTGLGLAIARDFVQLHGGTLAVSDAPGGGALFQLTVPATAPAGAEVRPAAPARVSEATIAGMLGQIESEAYVAPEPRRAAVPGGPVALVVEDNHDLRRFIVDSLHEDYAVEVAVDGEEGLRRARECRPDIVVTDIMMPRMSGDQMIAALRADPSFENLPILVLSAKADDALRIRLLRQGAQDYVVKPFSPEELKARVANLVSIKRARGLLQEELRSRENDLERLAGGLAAKKRELARALDEARVAREQAEAAAGVKSRFLGMVSHELRSPLQTFALYVELLKRGLDGDRGRATAALANLETAASRMTEIVESVLKQSAIDSGKISVDISRLDLHALAVEVVEEIGERAVAKGLAIGVEGAGAVMVASDASLLRLVLVNLVDNAIKYTEKGSVTLSLRAGETEVRCAVRDTGPGISPEDQIRIFEPFEQVGSVGHKHVPGVGLGLALVKNLVGVLGCEVALESKPGEGSSFVLIVPREPAA